MKENEFMLLPFEISRIKNIINETKELLLFVDDGSCTTPLLESIQCWIDTIRTNKFNSPDKTQIDDFFDYCIRELENKKNFLRKELYLEIPCEIKRKLYLKEDILSAIDKIASHLDSKYCLENYLNFLDREALLLTLSLIYFGRDGVSVDIPNNEYMTGEEYYETKKCLILDLNKTQLIENKINELDNLFKDKPLIIKQILDKFSRLNDYLNNARKIFNDLWF